MSSNSLLDLIMIKLKNNTFFTQIHKYELKLIRWFKELNWDELIVKLCCSSRNDRTKYNKQIYDK